jgi:GNAT superfamily N-acetyltransferase
VYSGYFNHYTRRAATWWERRDFVQRWWRLNQVDGRWTPPDYLLLYRAVAGQPSAHLLRQQPALIGVDALPGRPRQPGEPLHSMSIGFMEEPVAAAVVMADPRRRDHTAYLGLLACANDEDSLDRLLVAAQEYAWTLGCERLLGPVGLSPYLQAGALRDHFHRAPPLHTPYNPPYLPDVLQTSMDAIHTTQLYQVAFSAPITPLAPAAGLAQVVPLDPARLAGDLLPLFAATLAEGADFPPPDALEADFLLAWWGRYPLAGWLALVDATPVGYVLLQPDLARLLQWAKGGRPLWRRGWLAWRRTQPVRAGRVLAGGVLPGWRGRGIGGQLWQQTLIHAAAQGWQTLTIGPLDPQSQAAAFLAAHRAVAQQQYSLYATEG